MITMLHRPSSLVPHVSASSVLKLYDASSMALQLLEHYCAQKRVILHWSHLNHAFNAGTTLIYCFGEFSSRPDLATMPEDEMKAKVEECKRTLARFEKWKQSPQYQVALDNLLGSVLATMRGQLHAGSATEGVIQPIVEDALAGSGPDPYDQNRLPLASEQYLDPLELFTPSFWDSNLSWMGNSADLSWLNAECS